MISLTNLQTHVGIPPGKDDLFEAEKRDQYKKVKEAESVLSRERAELQKIRQLEADSKGQQPAYIDTNDLTTIIEDLLLTKSPVSKAFQRHEINDRKCTDWSKRTIRYSVDKSDLTQAIDCLLNNTSILLMNQHRVLDIKSIVKSDTCSAALNKMKKQLGIAQRLQDKDDQLAVKDKTISDKVSEIERLKEELLRNKSKDWQHEAIKLKKLGVSVTDMVGRLGKGRTTLSNYLNEPDVKLLILGSN